MTSAVLKNRILDLTHRGFDESRWGAENFRGFIEQFREIVEVDSTQRPPRVIYLPEMNDSELSLSDSSERAKTRIASGRSKRIRQDLWRAIVDYASGQVYVWDGAKATPRRDEADKSPVLPTVDQGELREWRNDFVKEAALPADSDLRPFLSAWANSDHGSPGLPGPLRQQWLEHLKNRVAQRLLEWFSTNSIEAPTDLVEDVDRRKGSASAEALRAYVVECVRAMSQAELEELRLPAVAALRAARRR